MLRVCLLVMVLALASCRRPPVMGVTADVSVTPSTLDFGRLALGVSLPLTVEVRNGGLGPAPLALTVTGPFTLEASPPADVAGGSSLTVTVTFAPLALGAAAGSLALGEGLPTVALRGEGTPACVASEVCRSSRFDLATRACVDEAAPEGSVCSAPCLAGTGTCRGGYCLGNAVRCVDGDACTLDACGTDGGCFNPPLTCPVTDPCQSAFCDRATGCGSLPVDDGTPCGEAFCEGANICFGGKCQFRTRPNAMLDCRYTALASGPGHTCAVTRGQQLRCWGYNYFDQLGRGYPQVATPPGLAVGLSGVRSVATSVTTTWVARDVGDVVQTNGAAVLPLDATALAVGLGGQVCGIARGTGAVWCGGSDAGLSQVSADVIALSMSDEYYTAPPSQLCLVSGDGGVSCGSPGALQAVPTPYPATAVSSGRSGSGCARMGGRAICWGGPAGAGAPLLWNGGVTALATSGWWVLPEDGTACVALGDQVDCRGARFFPGSPTARLPAPAIDLSLGGGHACALLDDGRVACWGANGGGQLGERGLQPLGVQLREEPFDWVAAVGPSLVGGVDGGTVRLGGMYLLPDDAGATWAVPAVQRLEGGREGYEHGCECRRTDAGTWCFEVGPLPGDLPAACQREREFFTSPVCIAAGGFVRCYAKGDAGVYETSAWDAGAEVLSRAHVRDPGSGMCAVLRDGQVRCRGLAAAAVPQGLTGVDTLCLGSDKFDRFDGGGCARLDAGALRCWGSSVGSGTPVAPSGAWPIIRSVACGAGHACALSGVNIVQCWGDNTYGQLGLDGPASVRAVTVPMPEPVVALAAGWFHTCALLESGRLACWGSNGDGDLGSRALYTTSVPRIVRE